MYGDLDHVIHMVRPMGFESKLHPGHVCKLKKALYGLKQSPRAWFVKITKFVEHNGFYITISNGSPFVKMSGDKVAVVLVCVDELIIICDLVEVIKQLKENHCVRFHMKDLGRLKHLFGLEMDYDDQDIVLHQHRYTSDLLKRFGMLEFKPTVTPMNSNVKLYANAGIKLEDATMYLKIMGSLIYLTFTRLDIAFVDVVLSRYMKSPRKPHIDVFQRVLRYLKGTINYGVMFKREPECKLVCYCDSDDAGDVSTQRSTTDYFFMLR